MIKKKVVTKGYKNKYIYYKKDKNSSKKKKIFKTDKKEVYVYIIGIRNTFYYDEQNIIWIWNNIDCWKKKGINSRLNEYIIELFNYYFDFTVQCIDWVVLFSFIFLNMLLACIICGQGGLSCNYFIAVFRDIKSTNR